MKEYRFNLALSSADAAPVNAPILLAGDISENLISAGRLGYNAIEIHMRENAAVNYDTIIKTSEANNVRIAAIVTGRLCTQESISLTDNSANNARKALSGIFKYIDIAAKLKTDIIIGWIRGKFQEPGKTEYFKRLGHAVKIIETYAKEKNVRVMIEAINRYEINSLNTAKETIDFIKENQLINTYVHLDTFHMNIEEADISEAIESCGSMLGYLHVADSNRCFPGAGHIDFFSIFQALQNIKYNNYVSVECLPVPERLNAAKIALENIKKYIHITAQKGVS